MATAWRPVSLDRKVVRTTAGTAVRQVRVTVLFARTGLRLGTGMPVAHGGRDKGIMLRRIERQPEEIGDEAQAGAEVDQEYQRHRPTAQGCRDGARGRVGRGP